ncbi:peptidylprolyl isomerase [Pseudomonas segetis]|uniref:peptidylprolyl isomerase n=1 Tax=Pseudomonas segetis TaxID=298908 RepID=A0A238ZLD9_9PSED|nr:peptidylprolyl isomerase [Pseudomonas segetis]SNR84266.1 peptidyl-prolyl cis-trans isomerase C [Pseudomonas segetis]
MNSEHNPAHGGCSCDSHHPARQDDGAIRDEPLELIASSEQQWPRIKVNGVAIAQEKIAQEMQYHSAATPDEAIFLASQALVIRELLLQRVKALDLTVKPQGGETEEEAQISALIEREVDLPRADEQACQQYFENNRKRYSSAPLLAVRHILLAAEGDDAMARSVAREQAQGLIERLQADPQCFAELAMAHSDCPSKQQGGALGQISKGQTVPEFERQLFRSQPGLVTQPVESRYGYHVVWVDQRIEGQLLPYTAVAGSIRAELDQRVWQVALVQYVKGLVGQADIQGIVLEGADSPLVQ